MPDNIFKKIKDINPDIVHLHWIAGGFIKIETLAKINKPIVWTLHDMWAFTGGCHYDEECGRYINSCGYCPILNEPKFKAIYYKELYNTKNIHTYGYKNIQSKSFKNIVSKCAFIIFPSCSEGEASSVINVMVYGLIPIVSKMASIRIKDFGIEIKKITHESIKESVTKAVNLSEDEIEKRSMKCADDTINNHSIEKFSYELKKALIDILGKKNEL